MPDRIGDAAVGVIGTLALGILAWARARRRDEADTRAVLSADNREWAAVFLARLAHTEGKLDATEVELEAERRARMESDKRAAEFERRCAGLEARVAELERVIRRMGQTVPGETPPPDQGALGG